MAQCSETRKDGQPCTAHAVNGGTQCAGHAGLGIGGDPAAFGLRGHASRSRKAAARRETLLERISRQTEERASEIVQAYLSAGLERGDWRALEALVTRVHGKPVERVAVEAPADPFGVASMTAAERAELVAQVVTKYPDLAPLAGTSLVHKASQPLQ